MSPPPTDLPPTDLPPWDAIRAAYEHGTETVDAITARYGISHSRLQRRARAEHWQRRPFGPEMLLLVHARRQAAKLVEGNAALASLAVIDPQTEVQAADVAPTRKAARTAANGSLTHRKKILERLYNLLDAKLAEVERRVAGREQLNAVDAERESRQITAVLKTFEKLIEIADAAPAESRSHRGTVTAVDDTAVDDAARLRADILARYERLRGSGGLPAAAADAVAART